MKGNEPPPSAADQALEIERRKFLIDLYTEHGIANESELPSIERGLFEPATHKGTSPSPDELAKALGDTMNQILHQDTDATMRVRLLASADRLKQIFDKWTEKEHKDEQRFQHISEKAELSGRVPQMLFNDLRNITNDPQTRLDIIAKFTPNDFEEFKRYMEATGAQRSEIPLEQKLHTAIINAVTNPRNQFLNRNIPEQKRAVLERQKQLLEHAYLTAKADFEHNNPDLPYKYSSPEAFMRAEWGKAVPLNIFDNPDDENSEEAQIYLDGDTPVPPPPPPPPQPAAATAFRAPNTSSIVSEPIIKGTLQKPPKSHVTTTDSSSVAPSPNRYALRNQQPPSPAVGSRKGQPPPPPPTHPNTATNTNTKKKQQPAAATARKQQPPPPPQHPPKPQADVGPMNPAAAKSQPVKKTDVESQIGVIPGLEANGKSSIAWQWRDPTPDKQRSVNKTKRPEIFTTKNLKDMLKEVYGKETPFTLDDLAALSPAALEKLMPNVINPFTMSAYPDLTPTGVIKNSISSSDSNKPNTKGLTYPEVQRVFQLLTPGEQQPNGKYDTQFIVAEESLKKVLNKKVLPHRRGYLGLIKRLAERSKTDHDKFKPAAYAWRLYHEDPDLYNDLIRTIIDKTEDGGYLYPQAVRDFVTKNKGNKEKVLDTLAMHGYGDFSLPSKRRRRK